MPVVSDKGGGEFQKPKPGAFPARCVQIIDLGTHRETFAKSRKEKLIRKVRIGWELPTQKATFDEEKGEESFVIGQDYTQSLGERANLRIMLESWRGRAFTADELQGFDLKVLLGKACFLNIIHKKSETTKREYAQVTSVMKLPEGVTCPKATMPKVIYDIDQGETGSFSQLSEYLQNRIKESEEWRDHPVETKPATSAETDPDDDDVF
jgi:hypothetical protein